MLRIALPRESPTGPAVRAVRKAFAMRRLQQTVICWQAPPSDGWHVGAIVGPSGSGKSTLARTLWPGQPVGEKHSKTLPLIEELAQISGLERAQRLLGAVGLHSVPSWLRPLSRLSTGEAFRAQVAFQLAYRAECQRRQPLLLDEFAAPLDAATAASLSRCLAKHVRSICDRLVVVSPREDYLPWLSPDWLLRLPEGNCISTAETAAASLNVGLERVPVREHWQRFAPHHYLCSSAHPGATGYLVHCSLGQACGFLAVSNRPGWASVRYVHRLVILPQYQGLGIAREALALVAGRELNRPGRRLRITSSHPAMRACLERDSRWQLFGQRRSGYARHGNRFRNRGSRQPLAGSAGRLDVMTWEWNPGFADRVPDSG